MANALNATLAKRSRNGAVLAGSAAAAMAGMALWNTYRARKVEREHPPNGRFVAVDGTRLHYLEKGGGRPVVFLHGNVVTAEDCGLSRLLDSPVSGNVRLSRLTARVLGIATGRAAPCGLLPDRLI